MLNQIPRPFSYIKSLDSQCRYDYLKSQLLKQDQLNLTNRLIQQIKRNESQQIRIFQLENDFTEISNHQTYLITLVEQKNNQKARLLEMQQQIFNQLELQLKLKNSEQIECETKYKQLIAQLKNQTKYLTDLELKMNQNIVLNQKLKKSEDKNRNLQEVSKELQKENINLQHFSKKYLDQYKKAKEIIEKLSFQIKEFQQKLLSINSQLIDKNERIQILEDHLNASLNQIQILNQNTQNLNKKDQLLISNYQKLEKKYQRIKNENQEAFNILSETNKILNQSQIQRKKLIQLNEQLKQQNQTLKVQIQKFASNQRQQNIYTTNALQIEELKNELKRLEIQIQQNYNYYKRQSEGNNKITQQLGKYKKQLQSKHNLQDIYKSRQSRISRNSNISSPKKSRIISEIVQEQQWPRVNVTSKSLEQSTNNLRKIIENIARKVHELTQPPKQLDLSN